MLYQCYNIPHSFRIANHDFEVIIQDYVELDGDYVYGTFFLSKQQILIATKIKIEGEQINLSDEGLAQTFANFMREFEITKK